MDRYRQRRHSAGAGSQILRHLADDSRGDHRLIALDIDDDGVIAERALLHHLRQPFGAGLMVGAGHADLAAGGFNRPGDLFVIGGDNNTIRAGFAGALQHMDNHRLAVNVLQWFSRQARGGETRRNNDHETHE